MLDASWGSPLICAAANGREETARLLLARGADSSRAEEELQQWPQARTPDYLKIWQMAANGDTFPTFRDMMENLLDENFDSDELTLFLDWEVPEVISRSRTLQDSQPINFNEDVLFLATFPIPSASSVSGSPNVEASSLSEYLFSMQKEDVDVDFIYTIIELLKEAEFGDPESGKQLLDIYHIV
jgi:ankyrin repeat protein